MDLTLIEMPEEHYAAAGVTVFKGGAAYDIKGDFFVIRCSLREEGPWRNLVVSSGKLYDTAARTALSGTVFHDIKAEPGWSGTPVMKVVDGKMAISGLHIAGVLRAAQYNLAASAFYFQRLMCCAKGVSFLPV